MPSTSRTTVSPPEVAPVIPWPSCTLTPAERATSSRAASRSARRATAAYVPAPPGSAKGSVRPDGERVHSSVVVLVERRTVVVGVEYGRRTVVVGVRYDGAVVLGVDVVVVAPVPAPRPGTRALIWGSSQGASQRAPWEVK